MDDLNDLASAANQARPYRRRAPVRRAPARSNSGPIVAAIVIAAVVIGGAIIYLATRPAAGPSQPVDDTNSQRIADDAQARQAVIEQTRVKKAQFQEFAARLADALGRARKPVLQSENTSSDGVVNFTCTYLVGHTGTHNTAANQPTEFLVQFAGSYEGTGEGYHSKDTTELNAAFTPEPGGRWKISSATERSITHSTTNDFMGVPEKGGPKRDISNIDWFNAAVAEAQKPAGN